MKKLMIGLLSMALATIGVSAQQHDCCAAVDSVDILAYSAIDGSTGLQIAFLCPNSHQWKPIGNGYTFVSSDFGPWGSHKKMYSPILTHNADDTWTATWIADVEDAVIATAVSPDLKKWHSQTYAINNEPRTGTQQYNIGGKAVSGNVLRVPGNVVVDLKQYVKQRNECGALYGERMADDATRFADLGTMTYNVKAQPKQAKAITDKLVGIFFEDINYAADGGLYAELLQNRDFEYVPADRKGDKNWNALTSWSMPDRDKGTHKVQTTDPIHANNPHYLHLDVQQPGYRVVNGGYDGIALKAGDKYDFSLKARTSTPVNVTVALTDADGNTLASERIRLQGNNWTDYTATLVPESQDNNASLTLIVESPAEVDLDMVSLFPQDTFMGRKNGLRKDMAQVLADLKPQFVRFPGGCVAHGDGIDNIYDWKGSIGPLEARKPLPNIWRYHQSRGLGYYEYFQFCEDLGAEPLPVLAAGVPCQNSGTPYHGSHDALTTRGQQCGIPMDQMDAYIQDILDLIEYANGDVTTTWGAKRAEAGHPEPFNLKYIGIGNEDMITEVFIPRFTMIYNAVKAAHPEVEVVGTVGPFYEGADYETGWQLADELNIPYVDEHYYVQPGWMIYNQDYYDNYKRNATRVYLGEYAAHLPNRKNCIETALADALYLTSVERNADVVAMTSYAPLFGKNGHTQWNPNLIYFDNTGIYPTTDYYVQQMYGNNAASQYIPAATSLSTDNEKALVRVGSSIVRDPKTGDVIVKLVNLLPVAVDANVDLSGLKCGRNAVVTVLTGEPADGNVKPVTTDLKLKNANKLTYEMPAYSFTVVRISK